MGTAYNRKEYLTREIKLLKSASLHSVIKTLENYKVKNHREVSSGLFQPGGTTQQITSWYKAS